MYSLERYLRLTEGVRAQAVYSGNYGDVEQKEDFRLGPFPETEVERIQQNYLEAAVVFYSMFGFGGQVEQDVVIVIAKRPPRSAGAPGGCVSSSIYSNYQIRFTVELHRY